MLDTPQKIVAFITPSRLQEALGLKDSAVRMAVTSGSLPAAWYDTCERLAGRPLPRNCFNFKGVVRATAAE